MPGLTYADSGVNYEELDYFKRLAQEAAALTSGNLQRHGLEEVSRTRGESIYAYHHPSTGQVFGHVHEGLGTKNLVAEACAPFLGWRTYADIAQCTLAMGLNDAATLGIPGVTVTMHLAVGSSTWMDNRERVSALIEGWASTCMEVGATWAGGETPTLKGILLPDEAELSCSVWGMLPDQSRLITGNLEDGARIILVRSSGIHANGLTLARKIADGLPDGYRTPLYPGGPTYGEELLAPTLLYGPLVETCQQHGVVIQYAVNITGHGWRKLMRLGVHAHYVIEDVGEPQEIFKFMQRHGQITDLEMYGNYNMGAGFALYVSPKDVPDVINCAEICGLEAYDAGYITMDTTERRVTIEPLGLHYGASSLQIRD